MPFLPVGSEGGTSVGRDCVKSPLNVPSKEDILLQRCFLLGEMFITLRSARKNDSTAPRYWVSCAAAHPRPYCKEQVTFDTTADKNF